MKKVTFILASMLVVMLSGCGGGTASSVSEDKNVNKTPVTDGKNSVNEVKGLTQFPSVPALPES